MIDLAQRICGSSVEPGAKLHKAMRTEMLAALTVVSLIASPAFGADSVPAADEWPSAASLRPSIGLTVLGGVSMPSCIGQSGACATPLETVPSLRALVLYQPTAQWGFGLVGQLAWVHWSATYLPYSARPTLQTVQSDLTTGFTGVIARLTPVPDWRVTPIIEFALGGAFQTQTGSNFSCHRGLTPGAQLGAGWTARVIPAISVFAIASAGGGFPTSDCDVSDGAPATPFVGWGYGLHAGASFDVGIGSRPPASAVARR